ncbi:MAG: hypothetical protein HY260_03595 [Chloroflexi bacterium]|nr:hypothetical protein [Chloroflexota bacterium]
MANKVAAQVKFEKESIWMFRQGSQWHRDVLTRMTESTSTREPVLTTEIAHRLTGYLGFRHFYRHSYSFYLEWDELEKLVTPLAEVWRQTKDELQRFADSLSAGESLE